MIRKYLIVITIIVAVFYLINSQDGKKPFTLVNLESVKENPEKQISQTVDEVFRYLERIENGEKNDPNFEKTHFTSDFKMFINGSQVVKSRDEIYKNIKTMTNQVPNRHCIMYEKIPIEEKCILKYDLKKPGENKKKVMAIYKFRKGKICEMDELFFTSND